MIETFNSMEVFEFLLCVLIILALLLEAISFWRTNKQSESILKVKSMDKNNVPSLKSFNEAFFIEPMKDFKKFVTSSRNSLVVYILVLFVVASLYNINLILISLSFLLVGIGLAKYVFYKKMYKEFYKIYLEINDIKEA